MLIRQKDASLRSALNDVEDLQNQVGKFKVDALERKTDEEIKLNEKIKQINTL